MERSSLSRSIARAVRLDAFVAQALLVASRLVGLARPQAFSTDAAMPLAGLALVLGLWGASLPIPPFKIVHCLLQPAVTLTMGGCALIRGDC
jgi:hypothetical protein